MASYHGNDIIHNYVNSDSYDYKVAIIPYDNGADVVKGVAIENPISIAFGCSWVDTATGQTAQNLASGLGNAASAFSTKAAGRFGKAMSVGIGAIADVSGAAQTGISTIQKWGGISPVDFQIEILCIKGATGALGINEFIKFSLELVLPDKLNSAFIPPPYMYVPNLAIEAWDDTDACQILIGKHGSPHLHIRNMLCQNVVITPSVQLGNDNTPLYVRGTYQFKAGRGFDVETAMKWFEYNKSGGL